MASTARNGILCVSSVSNATAATAGAGPRATAEAASHIRLLPFLSILLQLGLFLVVLYLYDLESRAFLHLGIAVFFGFAVHYFLPPRFRRPFFAALSLFGLATVFGFQLERWSVPGLFSAAWIVVLGLGIIGLCHLPVPFRARVAIVVAAGAALAAMRAGYLASPWSAGIWPVLGSMFMFRTALYLHAMRYEKQPATPVDALCYFFMLPNPCFPLFPVVDFQTLRRTYYDAADRHAIYQTGVTWLLRGTTHLILYRLVYSTYVIGAADVATVPQLVQFLLWPFLLYLRVSGQFHIIVGMLHLFGFKLPETHRLYYLSSSFSDFWRRINIYWKDFMMKLFFYPSYVRLKKWGPTTALVVATVIVFASTWVLHAYQWFWIRGTWLLTWNDSLFWAILAALVIVNALYESTYGRKRTLGTTRTSWREAAATGLKAIGVFWTIAVLWSFWSAESVREWLSAFTVLGDAAPGELVRALALVAAVCAAIGLAAAYFAVNQWRQPPSFARSAGAGTVLGLLLIGVTAPHVGEALTPAARRTLARLRTSELNRRDFANMERGYYENLVEVGQFSPELLEVYRTRPADWVFGFDNPAFRPVDYAPYWELKPHFTGRALGASFNTNSHGMRDQEYTRERPPGVVRIALVGASFVMGAGVEGQHTFDTLIEQRLNAGTTPPRYEVLNFGVASYTQIQLVGAVETKALGFSPDVLLFFEHGNALLPTMNGIVNVFYSGRFEEYPFLREIARKAGIARGVDRVVIRRRLQPHQHDILGGIYRHIAAACRARNVRPVWVYLPRPESFDRGPTETELRLAREAGFDVLVLEDVYETDDWDSLWIARWDHHPNALGHRMIADRLFDALRQAALIPRPEDPRYNAARATASAGDP